MREESRVENRESSEASFRSDKKPLGSRLSTLAAFFLLSPLPALAAPWQVDYAASSLTFSGAQANDPFTGSFKSFTAEIDFDPAAPQTGHIAVRVDMASASLPDDEQNASLPTEDWFFTEKFPRATFRSSAIRATGKNTYAADGILTIRAVSKQITLPFTLTETGAEGETTLMRNDFALGGKQWADDRWIAYPVKLRYTLTARPQ